jgi:hypothetical protein
MLPGNGFRTLALLCSETEASRETSFPPLAVDVFIRIKGHKQNLWRVVDIDGCESTSESGRIVISVVENDSSKDRLLRPRYGTSADQYGQLRSYSAAMQTSLPI